jgi:hypothetical protein
MLEYGYAVWNVHRRVSMRMHTVHQVGHQMGSEQSTLLAACFMLISCLAYSSTVNMKARCFSKTLVDFQWTTWRCIPEDRTLV